MKKSPAYKDIIIRYIEAIILKEQYSIKMSQSELSTIFPSTMETICCLIDKLSKLKCFTTNEDEAENAILFQKQKQTRNKLQDIHYIQQRIKKECINIF